MTPKYRRGPTRPAIPRVNRLAAASIRFSLCRTARTDVCQPRRAFYVGRQRSFLSIEVGIVQWLLFPVAILAGMLMVVQSGCNGMLERILDRPVMVGVVSQALGLTTLVFAGIAIGELGFPDSSRIMQGPWWAWLGGLCGAVSLLSQPIAAPRLGAGTYIGLFITASSVMSVIFDHFGWLGFAEHPAGVARVLGCALMVVGIALISMF